MLRICEQAANIHMHTHRRTHNCMLFTSITPHLLVPVGQLDLSLHPHLVNIHSHCQDNMLSKIHAEPERTHMASQTNAHNPPTDSRTSAHTRDPHRGSEISFLLRL